MVRLNLSIGLILLGLMVLRAQRSDLYLLDIAEINGNYQLNNPRLLSHFNLEGYTNQPCFADLYTLLVSVGKSSSPGETDIYSLDLRNNEILRITQTPDREYSPQIDIKDHSKFNCVLVDTKNENAQILWQYPRDRSSGGKQISIQSGEVGYYCQLDSSWYAVFELGNPNKLWLHNLETKEKRFITNNPGRTLKRDTDGSLIYVHKFSDQYWFIKKVNTSSFLPSIVKKTLPDTEDFEVLSDGTIIMAQKSKVFALDRGEQPQWSQVADLSTMGIVDITRLAYNGINQLALVQKK